MDISKIITTIYEESLQLVPLFRMIWGATVIFGMAMLIIAFLLKKDPFKKNSPWIVGGIGLLLVISSGTQLIVSCI